MNKYTKDVSSHPQSFAARETRQPCRSLVDPELGAHSTLENTATRQHRLYTRTGDDDEENRIRPSMIDAFEARSLQLHTYTKLNAIHVVRRLLSKILYIGKSSYVE